MIDELIAFRDIKLQTFARIIFSLTLLYYLMLFFSYLLTLYSAKAIIVPHQMI